jgi:hypothetical protein
MIHEAKVTFHTRMHLNFTRKQDALQYELEKEYDLYIMLDSIYLSILVDEENPLCKIQTKIVDFKRAKKGEPHPPQKDK